MTRHDNFEHIEDTDDRDYAIQYARKLLTAEKYFLSIDGENTHRLEVDLYPYFSPQPAQRGESYWRTSVSLENSKLITIVKVLAWEIFAVTSEEVDALLVVHDAEDSELYEAMRDMYNMQRLAIVDDAPEMALPPNISLEP